MPVIQIKDYLKDNLQIYKGKVKNVVLGCTHYPLIKDEIKEVLGNNIVFFNGAPYLAKHLKEVLEEKEFLSNNNGTIEFIDSQGLKEKEDRFWKLLKQN